MRAREILRWLEEEPFNPFLIELVSGKRIRVRHPENVAMFPDRSNVAFFLVIEVGGRGPREHCFAPDAVVRLGRAPGNGTRGK